MELRKDDGSELKKGEYEIPGCGKKFVLKGNVEELKIFAELEAERIRCYMNQNLLLDAENRLLKRRLLNKRANLITHWLQLTDLRYYENSCVWELEISCWPI